MIKEGQVLQNEWTMLEHERVSATDLVKQLRRKLDKEKERQEQLCYILQMKEDFKKDGINERWDGSAKIQA